jgi:hypothetical protein
MNIEYVLSHLGLDYRLKDGNIKKKTLFKNVSTIQQAKEEDLCYCSFEDEEAVSLISKSHGGIILCKNSVESFIDQYYQRATEDKEHHRHLVLDHQQKQQQQLIIMLYFKTETVIDSTSINACSGFFMNSFGSPSHKTIRTNKYYDT